MRNKKAAISFIFITLLIDVTGLGIIIPVLPSLIKELINGDLSEASIYGGWLTFCYAFMQFLFAPILGGLSDRFGRRPILLFSLFGFGVDYIFMAMAPTITWLFVGRIISGITGASFTTASAYIADISPPEKRSQNFGMIGAAFGLGFIIGPAMAGFLAEYGNRVPFLAAAALALLNWLYGFFVLPESLRPEDRRSFHIKRANPIGSWWHLKKYHVIVGLLVPIILIYIAAHATQSTWAYYTMQKFKWDERDVGFSLAFVGLMVALVQGVLIRYIIPKIGQVKGVYVGLLLYALGFFFFAVAFKGWMMYAVTSLYALGGLAGPSLQGIMSNQVPATEQGELQGGLTSIMSITSFIGPPLMTGIFAYFTDPNDLNIYFPGAPFILGFFLTILCLFFTYRTLNKLS